MRHLPSPLIILMHLLVVTIFSGSPAFSQDPPENAIGSRPSGTYHSDDFDSVDMATGRLNLHIPLFVDHSQRGKLNFSYSLAYTSTGTWTQVWHGSVLTLEPPQYGVNGLQFITDGAPSSTSGQCSHPVPGHTDCESWVAEGGFGMGPIHPFGSLETIDGSGITVGLVNKEGISFGNNSGTIEDPNGNKITFSRTYPVNTMSDTLGRPWTTTQASSDVSGCPTGGPVASSMSVIWSIPGPGNVNNGVRTFKFCYSWYTITVNFPGSNTWGAEHYLLSGVVLPDDTVWRFDYANNGFGDLTAVYPPTGGHVSYAWPGRTTTIGGCYPGDVGTRTILSRTKFDGTNSSTWNYTVGSGTITATDPFNNDTVYTGNICNGLISQIHYYLGSQSGGTLLKTEQKSYLNLTNPFPCDVTQNCSYPPPALPQSTTTIWPNGEQSQVKLTYDSALTFTDSNPDPFPHYGPYTSSYGLVMAESHSDFGSGAAGPIISTMNANYLALTNSSYATANILDLPVSTVTTDGNATPNVCAEIDYGYDEYNADSAGVTQQHVAAPNSVRGNLTSVTRQLFTNPCASPTPSKTPLKTIKHVYDTGMVHTSTDPLLNTTTYAYSPTFYGAYVTQTTMPSTTSPSAANHIVSGNYDLNTGLLTSFTDQNSNVTSFIYDVMMRPTNATYPSPDGGQTNFYYANTTTVEMQKLIAGTTWTDSFTYYDGLGRESRSMSKNDETLPWDQVDTCYDADGRVSFKSYPYHGNGHSTTKVCSGAGDAFLYDPLNRVTQVTHSDSSTVLTSFTGRATSVQDEGNGTARIQRISQVDGLGRLSSLCEVTSATLTVGIAGSTTPAACGQDISGTGFLTTYLYDPLGDLISVAQGPLNARKFTYDSLARLLCADNPEVQNAACPTPDTGTYTPGTIRYGYDANNNLTSKIAPMPNQTTVSAAKTVTTTMAYDPLHRLLTKTYANNDNTTNTTPSVTFNYDQTSALGVSGLLNTDGRSSSSVMSGSQAAEVFSYDKLGRVKINSQCTPQNCAATSVFPINYTYDLLGDTLTATNGEGVTLTYGAYNRALRITGMSSSLSDSNHPGTLYSSPHYNAAGSVISAYIGNTGSGVSETRGYDARLRVNSIADGSLYTVTIPTSGGYAPDSDILLANDSVNGNWTYGYDAFNRLASASATGQAYTYAYDRFGNRWQQNGPHSSQPGFDANNHMTPGLGVIYDAAGNETNDGTTAYTYDSENRIVTATNSGSGTSSYLYDADGRRIRKTTTAGGTVDFLYDLSGREITQVTSAGSWTRGEIYTGGRHLGTYSGGTSGNTYFTFADWLGTERARSTSTGAPYETCTSLPFGDWLTCTGGDPSPMHLTGKEHDNETGLDNFGARYDSSQYGRFMTPDWSGKPQGVPYAEFGDPQSLNLYSYVKNNPTQLVDSDGHDSDSMNDGSDTRASVANTAGVMGRDVFVAMNNFGTRMTNQAQQQNSQTTSNSSTSSDRIATALSNVPGVASVTPAPDPTRDNAIGGHQNETDALTFKTPEDQAKFLAESSRKQLVPGDVSENGFGPGVRLPGGLHAEQGRVDPRTGQFLLTSHIDRFNANNGLAPLVGHFVVDVFIGTVFFHHTAGLDQ